IERKELGKLFDKHPVAIERSVLVDTTLKECFSRPRVDDRGAQLTQVANGTLGDIDAFGVGVVERLLVHVLADDADPHSGQGPLIREGSIRLRGQPANAESGQLILWIVAGDDLEQASGVLDGAAERSHSRIQSRANHSVTTDQLLCRR